MKASKWAQGVVAGTVIAAFLIFVALLSEKVPDTIQVLYVLPVLITLFHPSRKLTIYAAVLTVVLIWISFFSIPADMSRLFNAAIATAGIGFAWYFISIFKSRAIADTKNKERLRALFEYATEGMIIANNQGEIVMINPIAEKTMGYDHGELTGKKIEVLIPERMSERHVKHREKYTHNPHPRPMGKGMQLNARKKDGTEIPVEISLSNFETSEGAFVIAFIIDISERKKSEELFHKEKELAQMYLDIAPVIFVVIEKNHSVTLINQNGCQILGYPEQLILEENWFEKFVAEGSRESSKKVFADMMDGKISSVVPFENEIVTSKGELRVISWKYSIIRDERARPVALLSSGEDITEKKAQEAAIEKANAALKNYSDEILKMNAELELRVKSRTEELASVITKLEATNSELAIEIKERKQAELLLEKNREELRMALEKEKDLSELKSRFVTMASHEFRTPLSTILSSASLIGRYQDPENSDKRIKHIDRIKSSVNNLTSILNDFLSLGKLEEGKVTTAPVLFDVKEFATELVNEMKEMARPGQQISYTHKGTTAAELDKNLTRNICLNLISNAIKYSDDGKKIHFTTSIESNRLTIVVADEGMGIPKEDQQHLFERFFRANNVSNIQGTGLGLNIVKKYVDLMHGQIEFTSEYGKGTTFTVHLPVLEKDPDSN